MRACWSTPIPGTEQAVLGTFAVYFRTPRSPTPGEVGLVARATDIARIAIERSAAERRIQQLAHYDELTGLPNRLLFNQALEDALRRTAHSAQPLALLFVDVDRFKNVNDTLGHDSRRPPAEGGGGRACGAACAGPTCWRASAATSSWCCCRNCLTKAMPPGVAARLLAALTDPLRLDDQECHVTASIGVATCPQDGRDAQTLQKHADTALHRAKDQGRNSFCHYSPQGDVHSRERLTLEAHLRRALGRGELDLHYQPKQAIAGGADHRHGGAAAVASRRAGDGGAGPLHPDRRGDRADRADRRMGAAHGLHARCRVAPRCRDRASAHGGEPVGPAVRRPVAGPAGRERAGAKRGCRRRCLELEITESLVMQNPEQAARLLGQLKEMGVHLAMDDFGTGYSSLAYLKRFPVDSIKIDRSFIQGLPGDEEDATITQAVIAMAHSLRLRTIAEGVETAEQLAFLERLGCDEIQGYYFSKPLPFAELQQFLAAHPPRSTPVRATPHIPVWP